VRAGVDSDHCLQTPELIKMRSEAGIFLEIQEKSITRENIRTLTKGNLFPFFCFVTDDVMPDHLVEKGHLDYLLKLAMAESMRFEDALYCATWTPAQRMQLKERGALMPGRLADMVLLSDKENFKIESVFKSGRQVVAKGKLIKPSPILNYPQERCLTLKRKPVQKEDFIPKAKGTKVILRVADRNPITTYTSEAEVEVTIKDGVIDYQSAGLNLMAVAERYGHESPLAIGYLKNGLSKDSAAATSWAHDHHNILVIGNNPDKMAQAVNLLLKEQGGIVCIDENNHGHFCPLPYGGIVSLKPIKQLAKELLEVRSAMRCCGFEAANEIMSLATLSLPVSPALKITDKGLIRVDTQALVSAVVETSQDKETG